PLTSPSRPIKPFVRAGPRTFSGGKVGASLRGEPKVSARPSLRRRTRRNGHGKPCSGSAVASQRQAPSPARTVAPPVIKLRRVSRRNSCSAEALADVVTGFGSYILRLPHWHQLIARDHRAEVVPPCPKDLDNVDDKEQHVADRQDEMLR